MDFFRDSHQFAYSCTEKNGRIFRCLEMKEKEAVMMKKKIQKVFGKLTELDNNLFLHLDLYNVDTFYERLKEK